MGDKFENISGNVVKDSKGNVVQGQGDISIAGSFIREKFGEDAAEALVKVSEIIKQSNNSDAKELFELMNEELIKEKPKKSLLISIWSGITSAVPIIKSSIDVFEKVSTMIQGLG